MEKVKLVSAYYEPALCTFIHRYIEQKLLKTEFYINEEQSHLSHYNELGQANYLMILFMRGDAPTLLI